MRNIVLDSMRQARRIALTQDRELISWQINYAALDDLRSDPRLHFDAKPMQDPTEGELMGLPYKTVDDRRKHPSFVLNTARTDAECTFTIGRIESRN
jgi:hypothetical protein